MNGPKSAGAPSVSESVGGTVPPTVPSVPHVTDIAFEGSLSDRAVSVTEPDAAAPAVLKM